MQVERVAGRLVRGSFFADKVLLAAVKKRSGHSTSQVWSKESSTYPYHRNSTYPY